MLHLVDGVRIPDADEQGPAGVASQQLQRTAGVLGDFVGQHEQPAGILVCPEFDDERLHVRNGTTRRAHIYTREVQRILVTGAATWTGGKLIQHLERRSDIEIIGVDQLAPQIRFESTFHQTLTDTLDFAERVIGWAPDTVVHLQTVDRIHDLGPRRSREAALLGTQTLLGALGRLRNLRMIVLRSDTAIYGAGPRRPSIATLPAPSSTFGKTIADVEAMVAAFNRDHPNVATTVLRLAPVFGPTVGNTFSTFLHLPVVPTIFGFDPRLQLLGETDAVGVFERVVDNTEPGVFNVTAEGQTYLSRILRLGKRRRQPMTQRQFVRTMRALDFRRAGLPEHLVALMRYGQVVEPTYRKLGCATGRCRETILAGYEQESRNG